MNDCSADCVFNIRFHGGFFPIGGYKFSSLGREELSYKIFLKEVCEMLLRLTNLNQNLLSNSKAFMLVTHLVNFILMFRVLNLSLFL